MALEFIFYGLDKLLLYIKNELYSTQHNKVPMSTTNIYVLRLEGGRYYIGKSNNVIQRYQEHLKGTGSAWTKKYKPVSLVKTIDNVSPFQEDATTKEYMSKYGIDKVRGGSYVQIELDAVQLEALNREIRMSMDVCAKCGKAGHFGGDCYVKGRGEKQTRTMLVTKAYAQAQKKTPTMVVRKKEDTCYRCGRSGHYSPDCYARTHIKCYTLDSDCESDEDSDYYSDDDY